MRVCLVYDCLFPWTVGGHERWLRSLGERLAREGVEVTYLTLRQWPRGDDPPVPGVNVVAVGRRFSLYARSGRRRIWPAIEFAVGVLWHLLRFGDRYDAVHAASFPYFSVLAAAVARRRWGFRLIVDWAEFWTRTYWSAYLGRPLGWIGWVIQAACARIPQQAFCHSELTAERLRSVGPNAQVTVVRGLFERPYSAAGPLPKPLPPSSPPTIVFAGRHTREKRVPLLVAALAEARNHIPDLALHLFGDGPELPTVQEDAAALGIGEAVVCHGVVGDDSLDGALGTASCVAIASAREGYGLLIVEAAARGCPCVVVSGPDNAAVELIEDGINGFVARSATANDLAQAIVRAIRSGDALRRTTAGWYSAHAEELSVEASLPRMVAAYGESRALS